MVRKQALNREPLKTPILDSLIKDAAANACDLSEIPLDETWRQEIELWLQFLTGQNQLSMYSQRLSKSAESKVLETLDEIKSAYFLSRICGFDISEWEPRGLGNKIGEFELLISETTVFCEVKSPGWEREVVNIQGKESPRLKQPKYVRGEAGFFDNTENIRSTLVKAYDKFPEATSCLLIITNDLFVSPLVEADPGGIPLSVDRALYTEFDQKQGCFTDSTYERCSGILLLDVDEVDVISYKPRLFENPYTKYPLPKVLVKQIDRLKKGWPRAKWYSRVANRARVKLLVHKYKYSKGTSSRMLMLLISALLR